MKRILKPAVCAIAALFVLSACDVIPRGAALQSEILGAAAEENSATSDFQVARVTRATVAKYAAWPRQNSGALPWINRVAQPATRIIAAGDTLHVMVWSTEVDGLLTGAGQRLVALPDSRVSPSGTIFLPYAGEVSVAGMSPEAARGRIEAKLGEVMSSVQVQLSLEEGRENTVSLVGGVSAPGVYPMPDSDFTVLGLLAVGGGVTPGLVNPQIRLHRDGHIFGTSVDRLMSNPRLDTTLVGSDKVFVEAEDRYFLSLGAAQSEAVHYFPKDRVSALDAMAIVGGVSDGRADPQGILILREYPDRALRNDVAGPNRNRVVFVVGLTSADGLFSAARFDIQPGDLVYVTESPVTAANGILGLIGSALGIGSSLGL